MIVELSEKVDKLKRKVFIELRSQDELKNLAIQKIKLLAAIPAIQPISNKQLVAIASGFGSRIHPIYKVRRCTPVSTLPHPSVHQFMQLPMVKLKK
jgi:hypothetical protein